MTIQISYTNDRMSTLEAVDIVPGSAYVMASALEEGIARPAVFIGVNLPVPDDEDESPIVAVCLDGGSWVDVDSSERFVEVGLSVAVSFARRPA